VCRRVKDQRVKFRVEQKEKSLALTDRTNNGADAVGGDAVNPIHALRA
jgi:hypothetical protein